MRRQAEVERNKGEKEGFANNLWYKNIGNR